LKELIESRTYDGLSTLSSEESSTTIGNLGENGARLISRLAAFVRFVIMPDKVSITTQSTSSHPEVPAEPGETIDSKAATVTTVRIGRNSIDSRVDDIAEAMKERLRSDLDEEAQSEIAELANLLPHLRILHHEKYISLAEIATVAILADKPNLVLAKEIREELKRRLRQPLLITMIKGGSPPTRVIIGLGTLLYLAIPAFIAFLPRIGMKDKILGVDPSLLLLVGIAGALGSAVSIMVRIQDFLSLKDADPSVLFFTGFFKPVVGVSFALFVFAVLNSGLIPVTFDEKKAHYFFAALAFISGFSERFASDIASRTERIVVSSET